MINKKGDMMPEEALKLLLGIMGIILLFGLAFNLYGIFNDRKGFEQASSVIDAIVGKIDSLNLGNKTNYLIIAPRDWYVLSFEENISSPKECKGKSCLCICSEIGDNLQENVEKCNSRGVCKQTLNVTSDNLCSQIKNCISLKKLPLNLEIEKINNFVKLNVL